MVFRNTYICRIYISRDRFSRYPEFANQFITRLKLNGQAVGSSGRLIRSFPVLKLNMCLLDIAEGMSPVLIKHTVPPLAAVKSHRNYIV